MKHKILTKNKMKKSIKKMEEPRPLKKTKSIYRQLGSSNHCSDQREEHDFYESPRVAIEEFIKKEKFNKNVFECACGRGAISSVLEEYGYRVKSSDLIDRGFGEQADFLKIKKKWNGDIVTNPSFKLALLFIKKSLDILEDGGKAAFLLPLSFLESKGRRKFFDENPMHTVYVSSSKIQCAKNGDWGALEGKSGAIPMAWFVWVKNYSGHPIIKWFN